MLANLWCLSLFCAFASRSSRKLTTFLSSRLSSSEALSWTTLMSAFASVGIEVEIREGHTLKKKSRLCEHQYPSQYQKYCRHRLNTCMNLFSDQVFLTLILFLFLLSCLFSDWAFSAAENEAAICGQPCQHHGHQHAHHQHDQTNAEVDPCSTDRGFSDSDGDAAHVFGLCTSVFVSACVRADWRMMGLHWLSPGSSSLRMMRNMVKLSTRVTLKELRSPPPSGRAKLTTSARTIRTEGSSNVMKGLIYLMLNDT